MIRLCLVDDDALLLAGMRRALSRVTPAVSLTLAESGAEALSILESQPVDVLVSDLSMPGMTGQALMAIVRTRFPHVARVIATGALDPYTSFDLQVVTHRVIAKPVDAVTVHALAHALCSRSLSNAESCRAEPAWAEAAAVRLRAQQARSISADVARANPWLAMLLLQSTSAGYVDAGEPLDMQAAVRGLGPTHLGIMFERLQSLPVVDDSVSHANDCGHHDLPWLGALLTLTRDIAECLAPISMEHSRGEAHNDGIASPTDFVAVAESAALLRATVPGALSCASGDRGAVLHAAYAAERLGVPPAVIQAVRDSVDCTRCERLSPGAAVRWALTMLLDPELRHTPCMHRVSLATVPTATRERWQTAVHTAQRVQAGS